jgi:hypothetical protein
MKNIFDQTVTEELIERIDRLTPETKPLWGKMAVAQMLAHCNVTYEMVYEEEKHPKPNALVRFVLTQFIKEAVVGDKPYPRNGRTAPAFRIKSDKNFEEEKARLLALLHTTQQLGEDHFDGKASHSFGALTKKEWNTMFYKHLDHHLRQFGV